MDNINLEKIDVILQAQREIQKLFPECVLVGGTAASLHAHHRYSIDADSVMQNLEHQYNETLERLSELAGWKTRRKIFPVLILGNFQGVDIGIRQLKREKPLATEERHGVTIPTAGEMLRIKGWLIVSRNAARDFLDFVALFDTMSSEASRQALLEFDECYPQPEDAETTLFQLAKMLASPKPYDLSDENVSMYKGIVSPWNSWEYILRRGLEISDIIFDDMLKPESAPWLPDGI